MNDVEFIIIEEMIGKTFEKVEIDKSKEVMTFLDAEQKGFRFYHSQYCCESVNIEDVIGELSDLIGSPILEAEEASKKAGNDEVSEYGTWTFYRFSTVKGTVTVRWLGTSNGYYSESVYMVEI